MAGNSRKTLAVAVILLALAGCAGFQRRAESLCNASNAERVAQVGQAAKVAGALVPGPVGDVFSYSGYGLAAVASLMTTYAAKKARELKKEMAAKALDKPTESG